MEQGATLLEIVAERARAADVFASVDLAGQTLVCPARHVEAPAEYRVTLDTKQAWVGLYTPDRWLSESIEAILVHTGDDIEELLAEELEDQGFADELPVEHFRDDERVFVFRSPVKLIGDDAQRLTQVLLAYAACFGQLGDMAPDEELP
jgi:hypothetical protein